MSRTPVCWGRLAVGDVVRGGWGDTGQDGQCTKHCNPDPVVHPVPRSVDEASLQQREQLQACRLGKDEGKGIVGTGSGSGGRGGVAKQRTVAAVLVIHTQMP